MEDVASLQRTVRRCTAVLVGALGIAVWAIAGIDTARYGFVLSAGALLYLAGSLVLVPEWAAETDGGDASADR